ncbi:MAG: hypothetical protein QOI35_3311 [Cryptosporangiaceae bacterium]|nr:hypothetical protein [Cryptosporangiaceae bacterium]
MAAAPASPLPPKRTLSRRTLLAAGAGVASLAAIPELGTLRDASAATALAKIPGLPAGSPVRTAFVPLEQRYAPYLAILPGMTNDIVDTDDATRGFFAGGWWRTPSSAYNARVQEHVYTLSWFLANPRPWNPYFRNEALANRLGAAIGHYLSLQHSDGSFPEYNIDEHGLAPTGFGIGYLAKTLANLRQVNLLPQSRAAIATALHTAMTWHLNSTNTIWGNGGPIGYANQVSAGVAGSAVALSLVPDLELASQLRERIDYFAQHAQSPAGFFYEPTGMDINYNFEVLLPEIAELYLRTGSPTAASMARKFADWFGYNLLREPGDTGYLTYYAVSARTSTAYYDNVIPDPDRTNLASWFIPAVPQLAAFFTSAEDRAASRSAWAKESGPAPGPAKLDTSPRILTHLPYGEVLPLNIVKRAAISQLPYLRNTEFATIRRDTATKQDYLYARRPAFYAGAYFGNRQSEHVYAGTGFFWTKATGTIVHAQQTPTGCWGTVLASGHPDAEDNLVADYKIGDRAWDGTNTNPGSAPVTVHYRTPDSRIVTDLTIARDGLTRAVKATTAATEQIPLVLLPTDQVTFGTGAPVVFGQNTTATASFLTLRRGTSTIRISWGDPRAATLFASTRTYFKDGLRKVHVLRIPHGGQLTTTITVA